MGIISDIKCENRAVFQIGAVPKLIKIELYNAWMSSDVPAKTLVVIGHARAENRRCGFSEYLYIVETMASHFPSAIDHFSKRVTRCYHATRSNKLPSVVTVLVLVHHN